MFGREVELDDENIKLSERIESLEETVAELRDELRIAFIEKEDALADLEDLEDMVTGVKDVYDYWVRKTKRST